MHRLPCLLLCALLAAFALTTPPTAAGQAPPPPCVGGCFAVTVTPDGAGVSHYINTTGLVETFTVKNTGSLSGSWTLTCSATGGLSCTSVAPGSATLGVGASTDVDVTYAMGSSGGTLTLTATGGASDVGSFVVSALTPPAITLQVPTLTSGSRAVVNNRTPTIRALLTRGSYALDTTKTALIWKGDTVTKWRGDTASVARANHGLIEWEVDSAEGLNLAGADSALITARVCDTNGQCTIVTRYAVLPNDSSAALSWLATPSILSNGNFAAPFGPGIAVSGAEVETGFSTIPYFAMGTARSAGLVYSTRTSYPRALVPVTVELRGSPSPDELKAVLIDNGTRIDSLTVTNPTCATRAAPRCRLVLQRDFASSSFPTPVRRWLKIEIRITKAGAARFSSDSIETVIVDRRATIYGAGWWPSAYLKLVQAGSDRVLVGPTGTATIYRGNGDSLYLPPVGSFVGLTRVASGWELRARGDSAVVRFDTAGRVRASQDRNGNVDSLLYGGTNTDTLKALRDPTGHFLRFGYNSAGKLTTITDTTGRVTKDSIDASNRLVYDSLPSPAVAALTSRYTYQSYPGSNTVVLASRLGVIADTTVLVYDSTFKRRPVQVKLPSVKDTLGAWVKPTIGYTAVESRGLGALVRVDSAGTYVEMKDPLNNWTRSWLTRWGQAVTTWDVVGVLGRSRAAPDGRLLWVEGKNSGDSTRTYTGYDAQQRVVRQWLHRTETDGSTLRLDSLVYDGNHRVVKRVDSRGQVDSVTYDAKGNVKETQDPAGYVTKYWYKADGRVDSILPPSTTVKQRFTYDGTWKQLSGVWLTSAGTTTLLDSTTFDAFGRDSARYQKVRVRLASGAALKWQWRKTVPYYRSTNQVDSTVLARTDECNDPCNAAPAYGTDQAHTQKLGFRFDRTGRDSLRLASNDTAKAVFYAYDRLGRVLVRRPPDSLVTPPRDSMVYDLAGNLLKTVTRRGDVITSQYDSRNRPTATVIPGVGTLTRVYGGPLDQLTRLYYASPVDSIGGVNGEVRYFYDARGRLKADTSYTGSLVRSTRHSYDRYERDSLSTDSTTGSWAVRYDSQRGLVSRVVTPYADSTSYSFDGQGRLTTRTGLSAGHQFSQASSYTAASGVARLEHLVDGSWFAGVYDPEGAPDEPIQGTQALGPTWTEQQGSGSPVDSTVDSLTYDGWERLLTWRESRKTPPATTWILTGDSVTFDGSGNVLTISGSETYGAKRGRLTTRFDALTGWSWTYSYDAAGNQTQATGINGGLSKTLKYLYDALNRLVSVRYQIGANPDSLIARYGYDVLGRRIVKRVYRGTTGGTVGYTRMSYAGNAVAFDTDSAGVVTMRYTWGNDVDDLLGVRDSAADYAVVQDQLHSVRGLVRRDGAWRMSQRFLPSGQLLSRDALPSAPPIRYGWTGREYDAETGFYFNRARYYDPAQRRFTQEDPIGYDGGANLYGYVGGAVLDARDPSGMQCIIYSQKARSIDQYGNASPFSAPRYFGDNGGCSAIGGGGEGTDMPPLGPGGALDADLPENQALHCTPGIDCPGPTVPDQRGPKELWERPSDSDPTPKQECSIAARSPSFKGVADALLELTRAAGSSNNGRSILTGSIEFGAFVDGDFNQLTGPYALGIGGRLGLPAAPVQVAKRARAIIHSHDIAEPDVSPQDSIGAAGRRLIYFAVTDTSISVVLINGGSARCRRN